MIGRIATAMTLTTVLLSVGATGVAAQDSDWPSRPVQVVVSTPPGSQQDTLGRLLADGLQKSLKQPFIVLNVPGAGSIASAVRVRDAPANGSMILVANAAPMGIAKALRNDLSYDPLKDFVPVSQLTASFFLVVVNPKIMPAKTLPELIETLKAAPAKYNYASSGIGGMVHMQNELFMLRTGTKVTHVPYKSSGEVTNALLAGFVDLSVNTTDALQQVKAGQLRALAVTSNARLPELPDVPAMKEILPGYGNAAVWQGVFVRAGTPRAIIDKLNKAIGDFLRQSDDARLEALGLTPAPTTPEEFATLVREDANTWAEVIKTNGIEHGLP